MALKIQGIVREFHYTKNGTVIKLSDPDKESNLDDVLSFYANTYPELTTATMQGPEIKGDKAVYTIKTTIGTKG